MAISQYPAASWESYRRKRSCLPEIAPQGHFLALRAQGATSACGLLAMTNRGAFTVLTIVCQFRRCVAGPGCPLPYNAQTTALHNSGFSSKCI